MVRIPQIGVMLGRREGVVTLGTCNGNGTAAPIDWMDEVADFADTAERR